MTETKPSPADQMPLAAGDQFHALGAMPIRTDTGIFSGGMMLTRGMTVTVTDKLLEANRDASGDSWLALIDDDDAQVARWGKRMFARGAWPGDRPTWTPGTGDWLEARQAAMRAAWALQDAAAQRAAVAAVERDFGPLRTSRTIADYAGDEERAAARAAEARGTGY